MVSNKELESVIEQVNDSYSVMEKRIAALEESIADILLENLLNKPVKKESSKKA